jgi:hypothetical protein
MADNVCDAHALALSSAMLISDISFGGIDILHFTKIST